MGTVFRAIDLMFDEPVAVKVLDLKEERMVERFAAEADILMRLNHPAIVKYVGSGSTPEGNQYLAMEWLEGEELADRLTTGNTLTVEETVRMIRRIADGLGVAHRLGIVHRDLKPSNLYLPGSRPESVKILDFGVARQMRVERKLTATGTALGTPQYMSPEQAGGARAIDQRSDVFSLGSVMFECLVGRAAYPGETVMAVLTAILLGEPPRLRELRADLPPELDDFVARMMSKDVEKRFADGHAVSRALATLGNVKGVRPASSGYKVLTLTGAERRFVAVIAIGLMRAAADADMSDTMADLDMDSEMAALRSVAGMFGATMTELPDGSVAAVLDTLGTPAQQVERAARCALRLREQVADSPIVMASGWANPNDQSALDELIESATVLFDAGTANGVVVDSATTAMLNQRFEGRFAGDALIIERESVTGTSVRKLLGKPTACVGRARELALLETTFHQCYEDEEVSSVLVTGEAGMGKTRLLFELSQRLEQTAEDVVLLVGRGDPIAEGSTYGLLRDAVRRLCKIDPSMPVERQVASIRKRVEVNVDDNDVEPVTDFLAELAGVRADDLQNPRLRAARADPSLMVLQLEKAVILFIKAECTQAPVLIALEDLQWGDDASMKVLEKLVDELEDEDEASLMLLGLGREEVYDRFPSLWKDQGVSELKLGRLSSKAGRKLARAVLGEDYDKALVREIVERSEGNPYFLEELIRVVANSPSKELALPESVLGMVQARLDSLQPEVRLVLRAGSVFGPTFWASGVARLMGGDDQALKVHDALQAACQLEFIREEESSRFPDEAAYSFGSAAMQDAAYAMLTKTDRKTGHRLAGEWLEAKNEPDPAVLAEHYERGGDIERAAEAWLTAAHRALNANDMPRVVTAAERGVEVGAGGETLGKLLLLQAEAWEWRGDGQRAEQTAESAANQLTNGTAAWFHAIGNLLIASARNGFTDKFAERAKEMVAAKPVDDRARARKVIAVCRGALNALWCGRYDVAEDLFEDAYVGGKDLGNQWPLATARLYHAHGYVLLHKGMTGTAVRHFNRAAEAWEAGGDERSLTGVRTNIGFVLGLLGRFDKAATLLREQRRKANELGLTVLVHVTGHNLGTVLAQSGETEIALMEKEPAVAWLSRAGHPRLDGNVLASLSHVQMMAGKLDKALENAERADRGLDAFPPTHAYALGVRAQVLIRLKRFDEALEFAAKGMEILASLGGLEEGEAMLRLSYAQALLGVGRQSEAKEVLVAAAARLEERADTIMDAQDRHVFLNNIPENEQTLTLYELEA